MIEDAVQSINNTVEGFKGLVPDQDIQGIFIQLGIIRAYFSGQKDSKKKRTSFPKTFSIKTTDDRISMHEVTPDTKDSIGIDIFCCEDTYDVVVQSVIDLQSDRQNFNRFTLLEKAKETAPRTTMPALLVCFHYWLSIEEPLLRKQPDGLFCINREVCEVEDFELTANEAWNNLEGDPLTVGNENHP